MSNNFLLRSLDLTPRLLRRSLPLKIPSCLRRGKSLNQKTTFLVLTFFLVLTVFPAWAREDGSISLLSEQEAIRLGLERSEFQQKLDAFVQIAESGPAQARAWPNPEFSYSQESSDEGPSDIIQRSYLLTQEVDLSGRRGLRIKAADNRLAAAGQEASLMRLSQAAAIRRNFYEILYQQSLKDIFQQWLTSMASMAIGMRKRQAAGDISDFDLNRFLQEQGVVEAEQSRIQAIHENSLQIFRGLIGWPKEDSPLMVSGGLLPEQEPLPLDILLARSANHPALTALQREGQALELEEQIAGRWKIPDITFGLGVQTVSRGGGDAVLFNISLPIPVLDRNKAEQQRAGADRRLARNKHSLALAEMEAEIRGLWRQVTGLTAAARRLNEQDSRFLVQTAETAYWAGEIGVFEVLDAYRSAFERQAQALSLMREARMMQIELDLLTGEGADFEATNRYTQRR